MNSLNHCDALQFGSLGGRAPTGRAPTGRAPTGRAPTGIAPTGMLQQCSSRLSPNS